MKQFRLLFIKEFQESWRSFKLLWIPIVFISLGLTDPLTNYYMDDILSAVGSLPDGFILAWPEFTAADILLATTSQFQMIGLIVFVAVYASSISRERQNGTATFLYVRPLQYSSYFLSKWTMAVLIALISVVVGYATSIYYTMILYEELPFIGALKMVGIYTIWMMFVLAFTLCLSAMFKTAIAMGISLTIVIVMSLFDPIIGKYWVYSPMKLATYGVEFLTDGPNMTHFTVTLAMTIVLTVVCVIAGIYFTKKNASTTKI